MPIHAAEIMMKIKRHLFCNSDLPYMMATLLIPVGPIIQEYCLNFQFEKKINSGTGYQGNEMTVKISFTLYADCFETLERLSLTK